MECMHRNTAAGLVLATCLVSVAIAQSKKEYRYTVGPRANVTVETMYGAISVKPGAAGQVIVSAVPQSDKIDIDNFQQGNRIEIESHVPAGTAAEASRVDYELTVPEDATVSLHTSAGPLTAAGLRGDLALEGTNASVAIRDFKDGHVHVRTISGPISLTEVHADHVEISSISGDIHLNAVTGNKVDVNSTGGRIFFDGGFGSGGDYTFITHTGDIEAMVPASASADFRARSMQGKVDSDFSLQPEQHARPLILNGSSAFMGTLGRAASKVVLQTFSGKIHLKRQR
jgi:Putative adhesin